MNEKATLILNQLKMINPTNIHQKTTVSEDLRDSFHSVWYRHSPQSSRYMLLPYFYDGRVTFK